MKMTQSEIQKLSDSIASMLLSYGCHGEATDSLVGMGEITLRDSLVVAAAAVGSRTKQAWILEREFRPKGWKDSAIDLVINRIQAGHPIIVGATELKWWRNSDGSNASNRRKDLIKDFLRAAAIYPITNDFSFVALLSTTESWNSTIDTDGSDSDVMSIIMNEKQAHTEKWNLTTLKKSASLASSVNTLQQANIPIVNSFHTDLLSLFHFKTPKGSKCSARVWSVRKPQNSKTLDAPQVDKLFPQKKKSA